MANGGWWMGSGDGAGFGIAFGEPLVTQIVMVQHTRGGCHRGREFTTPTVINVNSIKVFLRGRPWFG